MFSHRYARPGRARPQKPNGTVHKDSLVTRQDCVVHEGTKNNVSVAILAQSSVSSTLRLARRQQSRARPHGLLRASLLASGVPVGNVPVVALKLLRSRCARVPTTAWQCSALQVVTGQCIVSPTCVRHPVCDTCRSRHCSRSPCTNMTALSALSVSHLCRRGAITNTCLERHASPRRRVSHRSWADNAPPEPWHNGAGQVPERPQERRQW